MKNFMFTCTLLTCGTMLHGSEQPPIPKQKSPPFMPIAREQARPITPTPAQEHAVSENSEPTHCSLEQSLLAIVTDQQKRIDSLLTDSKEQRERTDTIVCTFIAGLETEKLNLSRQLTQQNTELKNVSNHLATEKNGWKRKVKNGLWFLAGTATGGTVAAIGTALILFQRGMLKMPASTTPAA